MDHTQDRPEEGRGRVRQGGDGGEVVRAGEHVPRATPGRGDAPGLSQVLFPFELADVTPGRPRLGSIYGMSPNSPFIKTLAEVPIAPGVSAHSIIAVRGDGPVSEGSDGVVRVSSARLGGVQSELFVRSGHSAQSNPAAIAEVRRILLGQLGTAAPPRVASSTVLAAP